MLKAKQKYFNKLCYSTVGAVRSIIEKHAKEGRFPVGFSLIFYHPEPANPEHHWHCVPYTIIDAHTPIPQDKATRQKIDMILQFLSEGIKKILEGYIDDNKADLEKAEGFIYQVPGEKGKV